MEDVIEMENTPTVPNNELEQRYIRYKDVIKELTIMNDIFMRNVFFTFCFIQKILSSVQVNIFSVPSFSL